MALEKARLMEIDSDEGAKVVGGTEIPVQFNPQSLRLSLANRLEAQDTRGQQMRQYLGKTSTTLSFDLEFDTSDEGTTESPVSVRTRTAAIERFVLPKGEGKHKQKPPKARFVWKDLQIDGIIEDLSIDFDLFAADGTPLRAKMSVTMTEQDAKYQLGKTGPGANTAAGATLPGASSAGPGSFNVGLGVSAGIGASAGLGVGVGVSAAVSVGASITDSTRTALSGESAAEFATRNGLDPSAWRGVSAGLDSTLSLTGGAEIDFNSSLSSASGVGVAVGVESGASASLDATFGLDARNAVPTPAGIALGAVGASAAFAIASAGGVAAAIATVSGLKAADAATTTKQAFGAAGSTAPATVTATPGPPDQPRTPLALTGLPSKTEQAAAPSAPPPPTVDPRATSFGFGVPLRPSITGAADVRRSVLAGAIPLRPNVRASDVLTPAADPTAPPWTQLPSDRSRAAADAAQQARFPRRPCGCTGPCRHGGVQ